MALTIKPAYVNIRIGFRNSAAPLGERSQEDLKFFLILSYASNRADYVNYFVDPPPLDELLGNAPGGGGEVTIAGISAVLADAPTYANNAGAIAAGWVGKVYKNAQGGIFLSKNQLQLSVNFEGDSLTADERPRSLGAGTAGPFVGYQNPWPVWLQSSFSANSQVTGYHNYATAGDDVGPDGMLHAVEIAEVLTGKSATAQNVIFLFVGINNIQNGGTGAAAYAAAKQLHAIYQAQGYKTVAFTLTGTRHASFTPTQQAAFWTEIQAFNALMLAGWENDVHADVLVDLQSDTSLAGYDAPLNVDWFRDKLHFTEEGANRVANIAAVGLNLLLAGDKGVAVWDGTEIGGGNTKIIFPTLTFPANLGGSTADTAVQGNGYKSLSTDSDWGHTRISDKTLAAGTSGRIIFSSLSKKAIFGFRTTNSRAAFNAAPIAAIFVDGLGEISRVDLNGIASAGIVAADTYYCVHRTSTAITLEKSTLGRVWAVIATLNVTATPAFLTDKLWAVVDLLGEVDAFIDAPMYENLA